MSPNFSNFLVYRIKSLKMALNVFKCTHRKPSPPPTSRLTHEGGTPGGKPGPLGALGFAGSLSRTVARGMRCCQGRIWERHGSGALPGWHQSSVTQWQSPLSLGSLFSWAGPLAALRTRPKQSGLRGGNVSAWAVH